MKTKQIRKTSILLLLAAALMLSVFGCKQTETETTQSDTILQTTTDPETVSSVVKTTETGMTYPPATVPIFSSTEKLPIQTTTSKPIETPSFTYQVLSEDVRMIERDDYIHLTTYQMTEYGNAIYIASETNPYYALIGAKDENILSCELHEDTQIVASHAFSGCEKLETVILSEGVRYYGNDIFENCTALRYREYGGCSYLGTKENPYYSLVFAREWENAAYVLHPDTKRIEKGAFFRITTESLVIPNGVEVIDRYAFESSRGNYSVQLPSGVKVAEMAFRSASVEEIWVPADAELEPYAFARSYVKRVVMENGRTDIPKQLFENCSYLTTVELPDTLIHIPDEVFFMCTKLREITLPNDLVSIGSQAFFNCGALKEIVFPSSLSQIGQSAFRYCTGLTELYVPSNVHEIGKSAFAFCESLINAVVDAELLELPPSLFYGCKRLQTVTLPETLQKIGEGIFQYCTSLQTVKIPYSVTEIDSPIFAQANSMLTITYEGTMREWRQIKKSDFANLIFLRTTERYEVQCSNGVCSYHN